MRFNGIFHKSSKHPYTEDATPVRSILTAINNIGGCCEDVTITRRLRFLRSMGNRRFIDTVSHSLEESGFRLNHLSGGIILARKDGKELLIMCRRYKRNIQKSHLKSFERCINESHVKKGVVIHTGTAQETKDMLPNGIKLISGKELVNRLANGTLTKSTSFL
jgi:hypothetical protein